MSDFIPDHDHYVTRSEFEENASEMRRNFRSLRDEIREMKNWRNWTVGIASAIGSSLAYAIINLLHIHSGGAF